MKNENLNNALSNLDISFIENHLKEKEKYARKRKFKAMLVRFGATAACVAFIATSIILPIRLANIPPDLPPGSSSSQVTTYPNQDQVTTDLNQDQITTDLNQDQITTVPNPYDPPKEPTLYSAQDIAYMLNGETYGGTTKAYREIFVPDEKYLNIDPLPDCEYIEIFKVIRNKKDVSISEFEVFTDSFLAKLVNALSEGADVPPYNIREFSDHMTFSVDVNGYHIYVTQSETYSSADVLGYDIIYLNGNLIQVDQRLSDDEILESLQPIKNDLFEIFGVEYDEARVSRTYDDEHSDVETGLLSLKVRFYKSNEYGDMTEYIELYFLNTTGYPGVIPSEDYLKYCNIDVYKSRVEKEREIIAEAKMLSLEEAEQLLYNGYVFGGHSCSICMSKQDEISFEGYDYVDLEYVYQSAGERSPYLLRLLRFPSLRRALRTYKSYRLKPLKPCR